MSGRLPASANRAVPLDDRRLTAPSAGRNREALCALLVEHAPADGDALEIASGTGEHIVAFARALPRLTWQPSDIDPVRRESIAAWCTTLPAPNLRAPLDLDAARPGWHRDHGGKALVVLVNLLHLIPENAARVVIDEAMAALRPGGRFVLYGPFRRSGRLTSPGDERFDADLRASDPRIGYKNDAEIERWLLAAGAASIARTEMPANNLAMIATR